MMGIQKRITVVYVILVLLMTLCLFSLYRVSISDRATAALSGQYSRSINIASRRGFIYDRHGKLLNAKRDGYVCLVDPSRCTEVRDTAALISSLSELSESETVEKFRIGTPFTVRLTERLPIENGTEGLYCFPHYIRRSSALPHLVGYVNADGRGVVGAESTFDGYLSHALCGDVSYGYSADALGRPLRNVGSVLLDKSYSEHSGVFMTACRDLSEYCNESLSRYIPAGAVVITELQSGELLCALSFPSFDTERVFDYLGSNKGELVNRFASSFTPGSIFKTVVAACALERDAELYNYTYTCDGSITLEDGTVFSCHKRTGHGELCMKTAYAQSCNSYFISLALKLGADSILKTAMDMGLGEERSLQGICSYGKALPKTSGSLGFTANIAIGQGALLVSPLEAASLFGCAATSYKSEVVAVRDIFKGVSTIKDFKVEKTKVLSAKTSEMLLEMMGLCVSEGLGRDAAPSIGNAGGKTATAQTGQYKDGKEILNSWFCGVYPLEEPKYAIAVLCDGNAEGGDAKAAFRTVCDYLGGAELHESHLSEP